MNPWKRLKNLWNLSKLEFDLPSEKGGSKSFLEKIVKSNMATIVELPEELDLE